jgi:tRNA dimethylallyltransferase
MKLFVLLGPTASGKTRLSLELAERYGGEIISGDSMQVYRGMDIGTAKVSAEEQRRVPHHLIDIRDPREPFSVAEFQQLAAGRIAEIHGRDKLPMLVGGTGLYIEALCYAFDFGSKPEDEAFREAQRAFADAYGDEALHRKLAEVDPVSAVRLHPHDRRRVIRALEHQHLTGERLSERLARQAKQSPYELCLVGLTMDRAQLYSRIDRRVDAMIEQGLLAEVERLLTQGCTPDMVSMQGLGYKEVAAYFSGECPLAEAIERIKRDTRRFAKRQLSWFRHMADIQWVDTGDEAKFPLHFRQISDIITGKFAVYPE